MAQKAEMENAYQILAGKAEAKGPIWRPWQEDNINMYLKETEWIDTEMEEFKKNHIRLSYNSSEKKNMQNAK